MERLFLREKESVINRERDDGNKRTRNREMTRNRLRETIEGERERESRMMERELESERKCER